ncbi:MAG: zinc ribbon domain-containing protein [Firmicutes bacterium]|nr:zinc ribbon domain-containing protein [Bacillota bacterium]
MFFIMGLSNGRKELNYDSMGINICPACGAYCRYRVYYTYMYLSLFFIPIFKWSKQYYAECSSCARCFKLNKNLGKRIEKGEKVDISSEDIEAEAFSCAKSSMVCRNCGNTVQSYFKYCPNCGNKLLVKEII